MPCYHALEGYLVKYHLLSKSNNLSKIFSQIAPCASYYSSYIQRPFLLPTGDPLPSGQGLYVTEQSLVSVVSLLSVPVANHRATSALP